MIMVELSPGQSFSLSPEVLLHSKILTSIGQQTYQQIQMSQVLLCPSQKQIQVFNSVSDQSGF